MSEKKPETLRKNILFFLFSLVCLLFINACVPPQTTSVQPQTPSLRTFPTAKENVMEGVNHYNQGNYETAEYYFSKAVELDNKYQPAHCWLGVCYAICGQGNMALASLNNAIQIDPNTAEAQSARRRKAKLEKGITVGIGGFQNLTNFRQPYGEQPLSAALKSQLIKTGLYHVSDVGRNWTNNPRDACVRAKSQGVQILLQGIVSDIQLSSTPAFLENILGNVLSDKRNQQEYFVVTTTISLTLQVYETNSGKILNTFNETFSKKGTYEAREQQSKAIDECFKQGFSEKCLQAINKTILLDAP